jgi:hypothetical protein
MFLSWLFPVPRLGKFFLHGCLGARIVEWTGGRLSMSLIFNELWRDQCRSDHSSAL